MSQLKKRSRKGVQEVRKGGAVVEAALILPILVVLTLGVIDVAQYISLAQVVSNASREAGRVASRGETDTSAEVVTAAEEYFQEMFPQVSETDLNSALSVSIKDAQGNEITDLKAVESGTELNVHLSFEFETIRWLNGLDYWNGQADQQTTHFRRE